MSRDIIETIGIATAERPIKGFALDQAIYIVDTKQEVLDAQAISNERVAKLVVWARDTAKFMTFNEDGTSYEEKDFPSGSGESYTGQGLGVPKPISVGTSDVYQTQPVGFYVSQPEKSGDLTVYVNDTDGYNEFRVIYDNTDNVERTVKVSADGIKEAGQSIRTGEVWECRVTLSRDSLDKNTFFWNRLDTDDGYNTLFVQDGVESIGFDENKKAELVNPEDKRYMFVDLPTRLYNSGDVNITLDSSKPTGAIQLENTANYNWDYPELVVRLYVDDEGTYLGGFRIPYGFGVVLKYNLDNKEELNLSKGYWTWSMFVVDWSIIQKVATSEGQFASLETAYLGLFGDEGDSDQRVFYPARLYQDVNGWTQEEFTGVKVVKFKDKETGELKDKIYEVHSNKFTHHKQPYYGDNKLSSKTAHHQDVTTSLSSLMHSSGKSINQWISDNPGYTPTEFLAAVFDSTVLGNTSWVVSITTSNNNYNGTFPTSYQQVEITRTGGSARNFMRAYNKESPTHYFAPYKPGKDPVWKAYAYVQDIPEIVAEEIEPLDERVTNLESDGNLDTTHVESEFKFKDAPEDGYTQLTGISETQVMLIRNQALNIIKIPEETKGAFAFGVTQPDTGRFWLGFHADLVGQLVGYELMNKRPNLGIVFDVKTFNPCLISGESTPATGIMNWEGHCIPKGMDANDDSPARYIMPDGSQTTVKSDAFTRDYMGWKLNQRDTFEYDNGFVEDWKYRLSRGYIAEDDTFIPHASSPYYFCRMGMEFSLGFSKVATLSFTGGKFSIYQTPKGAISDRDNPATNAAQTEIFKMALATLAEHPTSNFVINTGE